MASLCGRSWRLSGSEHAFHRAPHWAALLPGFNRHIYNLGTLAVPCGERRLERPQQLISLRVLAAATPPIPADGSPRGARHGSASADPPVPAAEPAARSPQQISPLQFAADVGGGGIGDEDEGEASAVAQHQLLSQLAAVGIAPRVDAAAHTSPRQFSGLLCPFCQGGSGSEHSLSLYLDLSRGSARWHCHRGSCGAAGTLSAGGASAATQPADAGAGSGAGAGRVRAAARPDAEHAAGGGPMAGGKAEQRWVRPAPKFKDPTKEVLKFFRDRRISEATVARNKIMKELIAVPVKGEKGAWERAPAIAFPYYRDGQLVNVKYRTRNKRYQQVRGAEKILYGYDDVVGADEIIIVEGEVDKLSLEEAGIINAVSVPDGAPAKVKEGEVPPEGEDRKFSYLWNCRELLEGVSRIVIATDNDGPGHVLAEELARRLGRERCWRVRWPGQRMEAGGGVAEGDAGVGAESEAALFRKDANEVLVKDGPAQLRKLVEEAEPYPIRGLFRFTDFYEDIRKYYWLKFGEEEVFSTGWEALDKCYKVVPGELTIVTGVPNSGKSEWIDALLVNLASQHGWSFAFCSMEKKVRDHARQLLEKCVKAPFFDAPYAGGAQRMTWEQVEAGLAWVSERFHVIRYEDDELPDVDWVLDKARTAVLRYGSRGLVIDPYNELDHKRPPNMSETEYVSQMLTKIKRFAQTYDVHVWFVAHPRQMRDWRGQAPTLYDISGSAHFINKADNGIVVHRVRQEGQAQRPPYAVQILVRKVRNKAAGEIGDCYLEYDRVTGTYSDAVDPGAFASGAQNGGGQYYGGAYGNGRGRGYQPQQQARGAHSWAVGQGVPSGLGAGGIGAIQVAGGRGQGSVVTYSNGATDNALLPPF